MQVRVLYLEIERADLYLAELDRVDGRPSDWLVNEPVAADMALELLLRSYLLDFDPGFETGYSPASMRERESGERDDFAPHICRFLASLRLVGTVDSRHFNRIRFVGGEQRMWITSVLYGHNLMTTVLPGLGPGSIAFLSKVHVEPVYECMRGIVADAVEHPMPDNEFQGRMTSAVTLREVARTIESGRDVLVISSI
jgi:hypothetical protein